MSSLRPFSFATSDAILCEMGYPRPPKKSPLHEKMKSCGVEKVEVATNIRLSSFDASPCRRHNTLSVELPCPPARGNHSRGHIVCLAAAISIGDDQFLIALHGKFTDGRDQWFLPFSEHGDDDAQLDDQRANALYARLFLTQLIGPVVVLGKVTFPRGVTHTIMTARVSPHCSLARSYTSQGRNYEVVKVHLLHSPVIPNDDQRTGCVLRLAHSILQGALREKTFELILKGLSGGSGSPPCSTALLVRLISQWHLLHGCRWDHERDRRMNIEFLAQQLASHGTLSWFATSNILGRAPAAAIALEKWESLLNDLQSRLSSELPSEQAALNEWAEDTYADE